MTDRPEAVLEEKLTEPSVAAETQSNIVAIETDPSERAQKTHLKEN